MFSASYNFIELIFYLTTDLQVKYLRKILCSDEDDLNVSTPSIHLLDENNFKDDGDNLDMGINKK